MHQQSEKHVLNINTSSTCPHNMVNSGPITAENCWRVWGTPANFHGFRVLATLLHGTPAAGVSQTLRRWTEGATYIRQGGHHNGHWPTFLVYYVIEARLPAPTTPIRYDIVRLCRQTSSTCANHRTWHFVEQKNRSRGFRWSACLLSGATHRCRFTTDGARWRHVRHGQVGLYATCTNVVFRV